eukprot:TRINITY_DN52977_c0_g1_i1.p1 TRINITY_DN52977_c0_g1~~TRINITY_DN52977_c0_g1_i1.p1  ORF type:complete len:386 (+),score=67.90 TRINITY_DN52977_c0_g1_i1:51-1160(+)
MQTNSQLTVPLVLGLTRASLRSEGDASERLPAEVASVILSFIGCNHFGGRDLRLLAGKRRDALWIDFYDQVLLPAAKNGNRVLCLDFDIMDNHLCNLGATDIKELARTKGVEITGDSPLRLRWSRDAGDLYRTSEEAVWSKLFNELMIPAARKGHLFVEVAWVAICNRLGGFEQDELTDLADRNGVRLVVRRLSDGQKESYFFTWQETSGLYESACLARQMAWNHFCDRWLAPCAARGRFCCRLDRASVSEHFREFMVMEVIDIASLHGVVMTTESRPCVESVLFKWRDQTDLQRVAFGALPSLWIQFYDEVLVPAATIGKIAVHLRKSELDVYFEGLARTLFVELAHVNGVDVTLEGDGARLSWRGLL